jgi:Na+/citrate or Na+/malate symporter
LHDNIERVFASYAIIGSELIVVLVAKAMAISSAVKARPMESNLEKVLCKIATGTPGDLSRNVAH